MVDELANRYPVWDGVEMKPGIRVYIDDRDHPAWDFGGIITDVRGGPGRWEFAISLDGPNGIRNPSDWMRADQVGLADTEARNSQSAREWRAVRRLKVFLCHGKEDKPRVRELYHRLATDGMKPWLDEEDLEPGQQWDIAIQDAVRECHTVLACLSQSSVSKTGYVHKEIKYALDRADEKPDGSTYIIPARLEECEVPRRLRDWQWVDLYDSSGYDKLIRVLRKQAMNLKLYTTPEW